MTDAAECMMTSAKTARDYMLMAMQDIDSAFGHGHAKENPALVAAYMQTAALDFLASYGLQGIQEAISSSIEDLASVLNNRFDAK